MDFLDWKQKLLVCRTFVQELMGIGSSQKEPMQRVSPGHSFSVWGRLEEGFKSRFWP